MVKKEAGNLFDSNIWLAGTTGTGGDVLTVNSKAYTHEDMCLIDIDHHSNRYTMLGIQTKFSHITCSSARIHKRVTNRFGGISVWFSLYFDIHGWNSLSKVFGKCDFRRN